MNGPDPTLPQRRTVRLPDFDYGAAGAYFVTVCSHNREMVFDDEGVRSVVQATWDEIPAHFDHVRLDAFVVMPNHVHGILFVAAGGRGSASPLPQPLQGRREPVRTADRGGPASGSLGAIVGSFKSAAARTINALRGTPGAPVWQRNYYEHVVRSDEKLNLIRRYIQESPARWAGDRYNPECLARKKAGG